MEIHSNKPPEGKPPGEDQLIRDKTPKIDNKESRIDNSKGDKKGASDAVHISGTVKDMEELKEVMNELPDVRSEKVEVIKRAILEGKYNVDSQEVANKILEELL